MLQYGQQTFGSPDLASTPFRLAATGTASRVRSVVTSMSRSVSMVRGPLPLPGSPLTAKDSLAE